MLLPDMLTLTAPSSAADLASIDIANLLQNCALLSTMTTSHIDPGRDEHAREEVPWHHAYPAPKMTALGISCSDLRDWMLGGKEAGRDLVLIDLRRNDHLVTCDSSPRPNSYSM